MVRTAFFKTFRILKLNYLSERMKAGRLYVLMFHRINDDKNRFYHAVPVRVFEKICKFFSERFDIIYFSEIEDHFRKSKKPAIILTFDDNHYDILENAYPALKKHNLKFNINVITESLETGLPPNSALVYDLLGSTAAKAYDHNGPGGLPVHIEIDKNSPTKTAMEFSRLFQGSDKDQSKRLIDDIRKKLSGPSTVLSRMLSKEDVKYLQHYGAEIGSHTHSHCMLPNISVSEAEYELAYSKKILEDICGKAINIIAYPNGKGSEEVIRKSFDAGYKYILLTDDKINIAPANAGSIFYRTNLFYDTLDENLAKVFGFHRMAYDIKRLVGNG
jgi:peptidoglycan/xylan/chitin deacetylase (PgdA/CDA1 family)